MKRPVFPGPFRRGLRRLGAAGLAAGTLWAVVVTAGSDSASAAWAALRAASPLAALKWELGDLWANDDLSPAAVMTLGESPLLLSARAAVAELWSTERTEESGADGREETVTEPVEETPLETTGETDNGVPARTLVPTDPSGYTVCGRSYISNSTDHALTVTELSEPFDARLADGEPQILILHTHGSEAYTPPPGTDIVWSGNYRTTDSRYNVVGVGDEMAEVFTAAGISVLHDRTLYDYSSYNDAYNNALAAIETYLAEYPSIRFILDVHRDAIGDAEGNQYKVISEIDGVGTSAQMTLVMGSDGSGLAHEHRRGPDGPVRPGRRQPYRWRQRLGPFHRQLLYRGLRRRFPRGDAGGLVHRCGVLPPGGGALSLQSKKPRPNGRGFCRRTGAGWPALRRTASVTCPDQ